MKLVVLTALLTSVLVSCQSIIKQSNQIQLIDNSCDLQARINDTIVVSGRYSRCMEYSGFNTLRSDSCSANSNIELDWEKLDSNTEFYRKIDKINNYGCGGSMKMTIKGILKKDRLHGYGHLNTNDMELVIIEVIKLGRVKYSVLN